MYTWKVEPEGSRFRWTVLKNGKHCVAGTRKREAEAKSEAVGSIKHFERQAKRDKAAA